MPASFHDVIERLQARFGLGLPGPEAHLRMAPVRADAVERLTVTGRSCREAAVLMVLLPVAETPHVVVTVRHADLPEHAGQVSLPGGRREEGETLLETALREAHEEIALAPGEVEVIGPLTPLYVPPSNYCVYPFLGYVRDRPTMRPHDVEVDRIVEIPLPGLIDENTVRREDWTVRGRQLTVPYFDVGGLQIWGATAMMLAELVVLAGDAEAG